VLEILGYSIWASLDFELMAMMLQLAVEGGIPGGVELVKRLAFTRAGDDFQHLAAVQALIDAGEIKPEEKVTIWLDRRTQRGTLAELTSIFQQMLTATFTEESEDYSQIGPLMNEALELTRRGQIEDSLKLYREIIRLKPDFPQAYFNLGALLASKLELSQAKPLIEQALHLNPDYTLAKITLAGIKARQDKLDEAAQDFLALEKEKGKFSPNELKVYYSGRLQLADWQQNYQAGLAASREWLELEPENAWLTRLIEKYKWQLEIGGYGNRLEKMKEEYRRKRWKEWGRIISSEVTLGEVLEGYNKAEMVAILKSWGKTEVNMSSKKETLKQAVWQLLSPQGLANEEKGLDGESREAFQSLLAMGGDAPYKEWQKKAGFTDGLRVDSPYLEYNQPDKLPGKLVAAGLVVIGGVEGALRAVVPHELRELKLLEPHFG
jgi:hypothetical protein